MTGQQAADRESVADRIRSAVSEVRDPEIDVTLADLGVLRSLSVAGNSVRVVLAPTRVACPGRSAMADAVCQAVVAVLPGAEVAIEWRPGTWHADQVSEQGLRVLRSCGYSVAGREVPVGIRRCPYCGSRRVVAASRYGGSVCKTPCHCRSCGSVFDELGSAGGNE